MKNLVCFSYSNIEQCAGYAIAKIGIYHLRNYLVEIKEKAEKDVQLFILSLLQVYLGVYHQILFHLRLSFIVY